jgi:hypothetical protein
MMILPDYGIMMHDATRIISSVLMIKSDVIINYFFFIFWAIYKFYPTFHFTREFLTNSNIKTFQFSLHF